MPKLPNQCTQLTNVCKIHLGPERRYSAVRVNAELISQQTASSSCFINRKSRSEQHGTAAAVRMASTWEQSREKRLPISRTSDAGLFAYGYVLAIWLFVSRLPWGGARARVCVYGTAGRRVPVMTPAMGPQAAVGSVKWLEGTSLAPPQSHPSGGEQGNRGGEQPCQSGGPLKKEELWSVGLEKQLDSSQGSVRGSKPSVRGIKGQGSCQN
ncbi:hypothetical protein P4O66_004884 [Electrophorus voltai]|uniref:Uncharacterized protein n=1 Tax=Electrophorus voltai TaxID=2609070 RepID=A0AAD8ZVX1_9TELE|nr:hypothetical protein P4O66_004884 [Electrophorus voltai]